MQSLILDYPTRKERDKAAKHIWERVKMAGELHLCTVGDKFRLELISEKTLRSDTIAKLGGTPVDPGGGS